MTTTDLKSGVVGELGAKSPVLVATMVNITLSGEQTVNGVAVVEGDNVLVNAQDDETENGVYVVSTSAWTRAVWFNNELNAVSGTLILTTSGTQYPNTLWEVVCADAPIVFGTSEITFNFFQKSGAGGNPLLIANNLDDVASASASRTNLGLEIGTNVQAQNANLSALAGLTGAANKIPQFTSVGGMSLLTTGTASGNVPLVGTQSATTALAGTIEIATDAEVTDGTDSSRAIVPSAFAASKFNAINLISTATASSSASIAFTDLSSQFSKYIVEFIDVVAATNDVLLLARFSTDNGSTYPTTTYLSSVETSANTNWVFSNTPANSIGIISSNGAGYGLSTTIARALEGSLELYNPSSTTINKKCVFKGTYINAVGDRSHFIGQGIYTSNTSAVNAIQFLMSSGNIASGIFKLYGIK